MPVYVITYLVLRYAFPKYSLCGSPGQTSPPPCITRDGYIHEEFWLLFTMVKEGEKVEVKNPGLGTGMELDLSLDQLERIGFEAILIDNPL